MTDGFYRLVDTYGLYTDASLLQACADGGLEALLAELRRTRSPAAPAWRSSRPTTPRPWPGAFRLNHGRKR
jgi:hypothetical protein